MVDTFETNRKVAEQAEAAALEVAFKPSDLVDERGFPINWRDMPVEEMTVGMLEQLSDEEFARNLESVKRTLRRARVRVRDYALSTDMRWFVTLTIDKARLDRYDVHVITKKLNMWLNHMVTRYGLAYVMVPEYHWDGAIHFHALFNDALPVTDSGTVIPYGGDHPQQPRSAKQRASWLKNGGRVVYNLPAWPYGFTTALSLEGSYESAVTYVCKYISKSLYKALDRNVIPQKIGGRWYYSGGPLQTPGLEFFNSNMEDVVNAFGERAVHMVDKLDGLVGVQLAIIWIGPDGVPRERDR